MKPRKAVKQAHLYTRWVREDKHTGEVLNYETWYFHIDTRDDTAGAGSRWTHQLLDFCNGKSVSPSVINLVTKTTTGNAGVMMTNKSKTWTITKFPHNKGTEWITIGTHHPTGKTLYKQTNDGVVLKFNSSKELIRHIKERGLCQSIKTNTKR